KPRITLMVMITASGGMWLAMRSVPEQAEPSLFTIVAMLVTTAMVVGGASTLNCYLERASVRLMPRTNERPLPAGRLDPQLALYFGLALGVCAVPLLVVAVNPLTGLLGAIALISYVAIYTPMKRVTSIALLVGA